MTAEILLVFLSFFHPRAAFADIVTISGDKTLEGIVVKDSPPLFRLQVSEDGFLELDWDSVVRVQRQSPEKNKLLLEGWKAQKLEADRREQEEREFARQQRARGLTFYQGEWLTNYEIRNRNRLQADWVRRTQARSQAETEIYYQSGPLATTTVLTYHPIIRRQTSADRPAAGYAAQGYGLSAPQPPRRALYRGRTGMPVP